MRIRASVPGRAVIIVEGSSDRSVILHFAAPDTVVVVARGKDRLVHAYDHLESSLRAAVVFILDCDGTTPPRLKGRSDLVLTANRDLEADLVFELAAHRRVVADLLSNRLESGNAVMQAAEAIREAAADVATHLGLALDAARAADLPVRIYDARLSRRTRLAPSDMPEVDAWLADAVPVLAVSVIGAAARILGWSPAEQAIVSGGVASRLGETCARHKSAQCGPCTMRRYCNGHDLVDALVRGMRVTHQSSLGIEDFGRMLRVASPGNPVERWVVLERIRSWQCRSGASALAG
jgi:hypothetical protein